MEVPRDLPSPLLTAFQVVGLPWPDVRIAHFDGVLAELGERPEAQLLREHVGRLRKIQDAFFEHLRELADDHDDDRMWLVRHKDEPCVTGIREAWAETAASMPEFHAAIATFVRALLSEPPAVPDYLAAVPAWVEARPGRGIRDEPTAGRAPAADALLRWREDPYGPRICVVTGSPAAGKTRLLSWFSYSGIWDWSGYPGPGEAAICLRGMDVDDAVGELAGQFKLDGADLAALDRPVLVTVADAHRSNDPERAFAELVLPLAVNPHVRLIVELSHPDAAVGLGPPAYVLNLDDPRATDRAAFTAWYDAERAERSPFTAGQVYPSPGLAALAARAGGADPGPDLPMDVRVARAWLDGLSPEARAAAGTLALAFAPIGPYTWRLLHCGRHRDDPEAAARGVAEAADRLPLAEPRLPAYAIGLPSLAEAVAPPAAAHGELAGVMRGWPVSAELSPPAYVSDHLAHHERLAGGPDAITPLPLRRPPTRVTRELLEDLYGPEGVVRPHDDEIHPAITHAPTRRFLAEVGLPVDGLNQPGWTGEHRRFAEPLTEFWPDSVDELRACAGLPDDLGALFMLDGPGTWYLFLDGRTGEVYEAHEELDTARVAHRDVESYAYFVYVIHRERRLWCEGRDAHREAAYWCADDLALELHTYEPQAMAGDDALWPPTLEDYTLLT
ncbi:SUKH-4 family immunity protein [Nonomuraea bangladeshensis]|uniref:SUKH-4 family immunity protein n=1 Tax=Nonomuraea bangladeshensis TaxID=404385 RepID=UPI003C2C88A6